MKISTFFNNYFKLGRKNITNKTELKKITLFNIFCFGWQILSIIMMVDEYRKYNSFSIVWLGISMSTVLAVIQFIHYKQYFLTARILYLLLLSSLTFWFSNYLFKQNLLEFYFFLVFSKSLIFIDKRIINLIILAISFGLFFIPNFYFHHYPIAMFNDVAIIFLFFSIYIIISYFKKLNTANEAELELKKNELEKINKFQSQFFINISHEIRTPLTLIKGQIDKLKSNELTNTERVNIEKSVNNQVDKIKKMVDDVLDLAKMETADFKLHLKSINASQLINKIALSFEPLFKEKDIQFNCVSNGNYFIKGNSIYLERALNNIVLNALKYTDKNGSVSVHLYTEKRQVVIDIKDTGIGLSKNDIEKIFDRFYQADNSINKAGGSGVGLAFSKEIIELHQGKINVKSELNKGSNFRIKLPKIEVITTDEKAEDLAKKDLEPINKVKLNQENYNFLLVDDNKEMRTYLSEIFNQNNCFEAENGIEGLAILKNQKIDFIITDYMMPKMNGLSFITQLKPQFPDTPIIMLTARADTKSKLTVLQQGIDDYIEKPFNKEELQIRVQNSLNNYKKRKQYRIDESINKVVSTNEKWAKKVSNFIAKNSNNISLTQEDIAEKFNLSKSSLYRKIKSETGLTPKEFITEIKLQKARTILEKNTNISLKQLSSEVGFQHNSYFSKLFKNRFGITPKDFSKQRT